VRSELVHSHNSAGILAGDLITRQQLRREKFS
jgi:hypothetical protein